MRVRIAPNRCPDDELRHGNDEEEDAEWWWRHSARGPVVELTIGTLEGAADLADVEVEQRVCVVHVDGLHTGLGVFEDAHEVVDGYVGDGVPASRLECEARLFPGHVVEEDDERLIPVADPPQPGHARQVQTVDFLAVDHEARRQFDGGEGHAYPVEVLMGHPGADGHFQWGRVSTPEH